MLANPEDLRGMAKSLRATKSHLIDDRATLARASGVFNVWRGPAADECRDSLVPICLNSLQMTVNDLEELAVTLERAADGLADQLAKIKKFEARAHHWFNANAHPADGSRPIWEREWWRYRPGHLPPSGDSQWLEAASYLKRRGVWL